MSANTPSPAPEYAVRYNLKSLKSVLGQRNEQKQRNERLGNGGRAEACVEALEEK